jgi:bifunctional non-homologous end joining protein LigD
METGIVPVQVEAETYIALDGATGLHTAAQFGAIELHGWMSRIASLDTPDRMIFDLDPDGVSHSPKRGARPPTSPKSCARSA